MPSTMAPTKANATYAVTTLSLVTKGPMKAIGKTPWFTSLPVVTLQASKPFRPEKVSLAALSRLLHSVEPRPTWLKNSEINALKSP
jgi:hypothetical protein